MFSDYESEMFVILDTLQQDSFVNPFWVIINNGNVVLDSVVRRERDWKAHKENLKRFRAAEDSLFLTLPFKRFYQL